MKTNKNGTPGPTYSVKDFPKIRCAKPEEFIRAFRRLGFEPKQKDRSSYAMLRHPDGRGLNIPMHSNKAVITRHAIFEMLRGAKVNPHDFIKAL